MRNYQIIKDLALLGMYAPIVTNWGNRPACSKVPIGQRMRCTDLNNMILISNGTMWMPESGSVLAQSGAAVSVTGTTSETTLASILIPGGMMGANGSLRMITLWSMTSSANNKTLRSRLSAVGANLLNATFTATGVVHDIRIIRNRNSQSAQSGMANGSTGGGFGSSAGVTNSAVDTSVDQQLLITGTLALGTETMTLEAYTVEILPSA